MSKDQISSLSRAMSGLNKLKMKEQISQFKQNIYPRPKEQDQREAYKLTKADFWHLWKKHSDGKYLIDERNQDVIFTLFRYFTQDPEFDSEGLVKSEASLDKGLLIFGDYGIGKTFLFDILHSIGRELMQYNCPDLWFSCIRAGDFVVSYMKSVEDKTSNFNLESYYKGKLYIDDLGFERKAFNKTELFAEVLFERNRNKAKTYVTTNLKPSEIGNRYGDRIADRLPEMFNIIKWNGESFRK